MQQWMQSLLQKCSNAAGVALTDVTSGGGSDCSQQIAHCRGSLPHILPGKPRIAAERGVGPLQLCLQTSLTRCWVVTQLQTATRQARLACHPCLSLPTLDGNKQTDREKHTCHACHPVHGDTLTAQAHTPFRTDWQQEPHLPRRNGLPGAPPLVQ